MPPYTLRDYRELGEGEAGFDALATRYPELWAEVRRDLEAVAAGGSPDLHARYMRQFELHRARIERSRGNPKVVASSFPAIARARLLVLALEKTQEAVEIGRAGRGSRGARAGGTGRAGSAEGEGGKIRLGTLTGTILQALLFEEGLVRKPAALLPLRLVWPLLPDRGLLMPLVRKKGIWCFYSRPLLRGLARLIGDRPCLEIAAGDGTLTRFLRAEGVDLKATDDGSWSRFIEFPASVERLPAAEALARHRPRVALCSWPPPGNAFEAAVFATPSVERYIVLGVSTEGVTGNREAYRAEEAFTMESDRRLAKMLLPPDRGHEVLVFTRRGSAT